MNVMTREQISFQAFTRSTTSQGYNLLNRKQNLRYVIDQSE